MRQLYSALGLLALVGACQGPEAPRSVTGTEGVSVASATGFERFAPITRSDANGRQTTLVERAEYVEADVRTLGALRARLPRFAADAVSLSLADHDVSASFKLRGATRVQAKLEGGRLLYESGGPGGADLLLAVHEQSVEDYVRFAAPGVRSLEYELDVSHAAGLRLVSNSLELLDAASVPRLRVSPPYVLDGEGRTRYATLRVEGCAYDTNAALPQRRPLVAPSSAACTLRVEWDDAGLSYPLIVDPRWATTKTQVVGRLHHAMTYHAESPEFPEHVCLFGGHDGSVAKTPTNSVECFVDGVWSDAQPLRTARFDHTATAFHDGRVLVLGGATSGKVDDALGSWEICDPVKNDPCTLSPETLKVARTQHTATLLDSDEVVVLGGGGLTPLFFSPDGTMREASGNKMVQPRFRHVAVLVGHNVFVFGGSASPDSDNPLKSIGYFNPDAGEEKFVELATVMNTPRLGLSATRLPAVTSPTHASDEQILLVGSNRDAELFDPAHFGIQPAPAQTHRFRRNHAVVSFESRNGEATVLLTGGDWDGMPWDENEVYSSARHDFSEPDFLLNGERTEHSAVLLGDGHTVLLAGGRRGGTKPTPEVDTAKLFGPGEACQIGTDCVSGVCSKQVCCNSECAGACEACTVDAGADQDGVCKTLGAEQACPATDACHEASSCDGMSSECPPGDMAPDGTICELGGESASCRAGVCEPHEADAGGGGGEPAGAGAGAGGSDSGSGGGGRPSVERKPAIAWSCSFLPVGAPEAAWVGVALLGLLLSRRRGGTAHAR